MGFFYAVRRLKKMAVSMNKNSHLCDYTGINVKESYNRHIRLGIGGQGHGKTAHRDCHMEIRMGTKSLIGMMGGTIYARKSNARLYGHLAQDFSGYIYICNREHLCYNGLKIFFQM